MLLEFQKQWKIMNRNCLKEIKLYPIKIQQKFEIQFMEPSEEYDSYFVFWIRKFIFES